MLIFSDSRDLSFNSRDPNQVPDITLRQWLQNSLWTLMQYLKFFCTPPATWQTRTIRVQAGFTETC